MAKARPATEIAEDFRSLYPEVLARVVGARGRRRLGDAFGLTQFGINLITLAPGARSALRHWHTKEDEFVYVLSGQMVLCTDDGEQQVGAGDAVGFPGGREDGHCLINRSSAPAQFLVVGSRIDDDMAYYPDDDLQWKVTASGDWVATHKDGTDY